MGGRSGGGAVGLAGVEGLMEQSMGLGDQMIAEDQVEEDPMVEDHQWTMLPGGTARSVPGQRHLLWLAAQRAIKQLGRT